MARKKRRKSRSKRRPYSKRKQPRRGCGRRNWRRGSNAMWKCKRGKRRYYKTKR